MKLKLDENLPSGLLSALQALGHDVDSVPSEQLSGHEDASVWTAAQAAGRFLVTQDLDFSDSRRYVPGTHHGLLLVRLARPTSAGRTPRLHGASPVTRTVQHSAGSPDSRTRADSGFLAAGKRHTSSASSTQHCVSSSLDSNAGRRCTYSGTERKVTTRNSARRPRRQSERCGTVYRGRPRSSVGSRFNRGTRTSSLTTRSRVGSFAK